MDMQRLFISIVVIVTAMLAGACDRARQEAVGARAERAARQGEQEMETQTATFAAGCFWDVQETFRKLPGVVDTEVGYTGGDFENPTYEDVCSDRTGHAEAVRVRFDPEKVTYEELLEVFWKCHDPTTPNRQGPDVGSQYRSAVFYHTPQQQKAAEESRKKLEKSGRYNAPIVTEIVPVSVFWRAEGYHQCYLRKRGG